MKGSSIRMEASLIEDDPAAEGFERRADRPQPGQRRLDRGVALGGGEEQQESTSACAQDLAADRAGAARRVVPAVDVAATDARGNALLEHPVLVQDFTESGEVVLLQLVAQAVGELDHADERAALAV